MKSCVETRDACVWTLYNHHIVTYQHYIYVDNAGQHNQFNAAQLYPLPCSSIGHHTLSL